MVLRKLSLCGYGPRSLGRRVLAHHARHAQESAKADAAAAHRRAVQRVARKPRQKSRDRDRAFEPRQRHPGALMRAGAKGEMPVRRAADVEVSGSANCAGSRLAAPMHSVTGVPAASVTPPSSTRSVVMRLPSWFELSNRRISSTAVLIRSGCSISRCFCGGMIRQRHQPVADQIGGGLVAGVEQEDAVVQQFLFGQPLAIVLALDQPRQHVAFGIAGLGAPPRRPGFPDRRENPSPRSLPRAKASGAITGSSAPRIASDQSRSGSRSSCGTSSRLPITSIGIAAAKSSISSTLPLAASAVEQPVHQRDQVGLHLRDRARRQRAHDQPPHPGVRRRVVEDEAGGVVLVEQRVAVFRRELLFLVGARTAWCSCRR